MGAYEAAYAGKLSLATGMVVTEADIVGWFEGGRGYAKVDLIVQRYLGSARYDAFDASARMIDALEAVLDGKHTAIIGGMHFTNLQQR